MKNSISKADGINQKLEEIRKKRRENRKLRLSAPKYQEDPIGQVEFLMYILPDEVDKKFLDNTIEPTYFDFPPVKPKITKNLGLIKSLSIYFPIGKVSNSDEWFIISPYIHVPKVFLPADNWAEKSQILIAAITYSCKVLDALSKVLHISLPYPIKIDGNKIFIYRNEQPHDLTVFTTSHSIKAAVHLLNFNAATFGHGAPDELLPNLYSALHPNSTELPPEESVDDLIEK
ncbi:hypothetical protein TVAG_083000 [Trichomonas vaginalis G3]|uniref:Uncharacterized protein n=1 Tax=Trichomonas vaginalis (strain ATCC PRA-98 / G3) TaxID=412133 RepID=A2DM29_TRIV3|nr:hypothetical protein TVAGG3_0984380 [Trichomonas vaginalis G3]EAY18449.1 hypothetical protein TVAG_083000 [Trichomonas vaginalis G3]KAI5489562.1 hypothetical protein TVAGG3_0984380 [Trichomonas vaginalis G3]|eukprot:XP_001579435.1 hypothetical protein [Trichomonas vaginalis G3]